MTQHTHCKTHYATIIGRMVVFMARPEITRQKKYREPFVVDKKRYRTAQDAKIAARHWEGQLI